MFEPKDFVTCKICGKNYKKITNSHLNRHNLTSNEYKKLFPNSQISSETYRDKFRGKPRSKEVREKISRTNKKLFDLKKRRPWAEGLSANPDAPNFDPRLQRLGEKISKTLKKIYASGELKSWNGGLTKEDHPSIMKYSISVSRTIKKQYDSGERRAWCCGLTKETDVRIQKIISARKEWYESLSLEEKEDHCKKLSSGVRSSWSNYNKNERERRIYKSQAKQKPSPVEERILQILAPLGFEYNKKPICSGYSHILGRIRSIIPDFISRKCPKYIIQYDGFLGHHPDSPYTGENVVDFDYERDQICVTSGYIPIIITPEDLKKGNNFVQELVLQEMF